MNMPPPPNKYYEKGGIKYLKTSVQPRWDLKKIFMYPWRFFNLNSMGCKTMIGQNTAWSISFWFDGYMYGFATATDYSSK